MYRENRRINMLRFWLMPFVCINSFGAPTEYGELVRILCGSATICFFILSGYLTVSRNERRDAKLSRAVRRTAKLAAVMLVVFLLANTLYYGLMGVPIWSVLWSMAKSKRVWFEFLVMNYWHLPVGENFWFVQSLLYAYIILYFLEKFDLLRFDWLICPLCLAFTVLTGELAALWGFHFFGYNYIPGNFLTRALPYLLLGRILYRYVHFLSELRVPTAVFLLIIALGGVMTYGELIWLSSRGRLIYTGHMLGNGVLALGICVSTLVLDERAVVRNPKTILAEHLRWCTTFIYASHQVLGIFLTLLLGTFVPRLMLTLVPFTALIAFAAGLLLAMGVRLCLDNLPIGAGRGDDANKEDDDETEV